MPHMLSFLLRMLLLILIHFGRYVDVEFDVSRTKLHGSLSPPTDDALRVLPNVHRSSSTMLIFKRMDLRGGKWRTCDDEYGISRPHQANWAAALGNYE